MDPVTRPVVVAIAALSVLGGARAVAEARPRVALAAIEGDDDGDIADAVANALDGEQLSVVYPRAVTRAIEKLGFDPDALTDKQAKRLAATLDVDALIQATFRKEGKRKVLRVQLMVAGDRVRGFKVTFNNARSENFQVQLRDKIIDRIGAVDDDEAAPRGGKPRKGDKDTGRGDDRDGDRDAEGADREEGDDEDDDRGRRRRVGRRGDDDGDDEDEEGAALALAARSRPHAANRVAARLDVGMSVQNRSVTFTNRANFPEGPKPYSNSPVPGARVEAELYPLAFGDARGVAAGFGLGVEYDRTLSLTLRTTAEPTVPVKATQSHWSVGVRFRIPFGRLVTSPTLTLGVGYGQRSFITDRTGLEDPRSLDLPDTAYTSIDPSVAFRLPLNPTVALSASARGLLVSDAGPIQRQDSYGQAKVFGLAAQAGVDIVLGDRFAIRLVGELVQVGFDFVGTGELANNRDADPTTQDVGGAADRSLGGSATFAVLY